MAIKLLYFDEMMPRPVANELTKRGFQIEMAVDVGMIAQPDEDHLAHATVKNAVLVTLDHPFAGRAAKRTDHSGLICWNGKSNDYGAIVRSLETYCNQHEPIDIAGHVIWLKYYRY
jgi:predicted nuclease of predicted toxin-antitoxin system